MKAGQAIEVVFFFSFFFYIGDQQDFSPMRSDHGEDRQRPTLADGGLLSRSWEWGWVGSKVLRDACNGEGGLGCVGRSVHSQH